MDLYITIGKSILQEYFDYYGKQGLDDAEYIPIIKVIVEGISKSMTSTGSGKKDARDLKKILLEFNRDLYTKEWLKHAVEDEGEDQVDLEEETKEARYYFDYIYKHGEHPH
jgi:hypothetical protein